MILIAASDPNIIYLLQRYAEASGFRTAQVSPGKDIVELACQMKPSLIILQSDFAGMVARAVLRRLKEAATTRPIPVVVYLSLDEELVELEGVAGYLRQSVRYDDFYKVLTQAGVRP